MNGCLCMYFIIAYLGIIKPQKWNNEHFLLGPRQLLMHEMYSSTLCITISFPVANLTYLRFISAHRLFKNSKRFSFEISQNAEKEKAGIHTITKIQSVLSKLLCTSKLRKATKVCRI